MKYWTSGDTITANHLNTLFVSEEYTNHLGATDNFMQTSSSGNGTISSDITNHQMVLGTGIGNNGHATFHTKDTYVLTEKPIVINALYNNWQTGNSGVDRYGVRIGLYNYWTSEKFTYDSQGAFFEYEGIGVSPSWNTVTTPASGQRLYGITAPSPGDLLSIVATSGGVEFFKNGVLLTKHTDYLPLLTSAMNIGVVTQTDGAGGIGQSMNIGVDFIGIKL